MTTSFQRLTSYWGFAAAGISIGVAFLWPSSVLSLIAGWVGVITLVWHVTTRPKQLLWGMFVFGFSLATLGYNWLPYTITRFGGFSPGVASLLFSLFCIVSALQFVFVGVLYRRLRLSALEDVQLAFPLAWLAGLTIFPQLFPWRFCHTQLVWRSFAGLAEFVGVQTLDVLMLFWATMIVRIVLIWQEDRVFIHARTLSLLTSFLIVFAGFLANERAATAAARAPSIVAGLVQGNLETKKKGNIQYLEANLKAYQELSNIAVERGAEIVFWPETVLATWVPENIVSFRSQKYDPWPNPQRTTLVFGAPTVRNVSAERLQAAVARYGQEAVATDPFRFQYDKFNSVFGIDPTGKPVGYFHKQALMPFGEYLPFEDLFPWLRDISPQSGDFRIGDVRGPIRLAMTTKNRPAAVQPLVCYEDLVQHVAFDGVRNGAELLVNLTNDAWYGKSAAPYQHHLIAVWRAIETRRYLLRVTNTGYTAVVNSEGVTVTDLPWFTADVVVSKVPLLTGKTLAVQLNEWHNSVLVLIAICYFFVPRRSGFAEATSSAKIRAVYE